MTGAAAAGPLTGLWAGARHLMTTVRASAKTAVCLLKVFLILPSQPVDWVTPHPVVERLR